MIIRDGHYRIFKDQKHKFLEMGKYNDCDENIPNMILDDYIKKIIDPIRNKKFYGLSATDKNYFENQNKSIRNLSKIGYRLLNFIYYIHLFFSYCLENLTEEILNNYLIEDSDILKVIEIDWNSLKELLQQKKINSIQIFINLIFEDLSKLIRECNIFTIEGDREIFENKIEALISKTITNYNEYSKIYNEENVKQIIDIKSLKTYVTEIIPPNSDIYSEKEYPLFKYFNYTQYKTEEDMMKGIKCKEKYPLINQLIKDDLGVNNLKYLQDFNSFTNYITNYYSFKISREDARKRILENEEINKELDFNIKFNNFLGLWEHIKSYAYKYKFVNQMEVKKEFTKKNALINFLNDDKELYNGMYLASACEKFIQWQNSFLQPIIDANLDNGILKNYINNIIKKVPVQEAKPDQIVIIKEKFDKNGKGFIGFKDVIYCFSERNIFGENGDINYSNYNNFIYDYDLIEEELGKIIFTGINLFSGDDDLNFIIYWGEGFRGGNSDLITKFYSKYPQEDMDEKEKQEIIIYISKMNELEKNKKYDFKNFYSSLQILLLYLTKKVIMEENEKVLNIINNPVEYLNISQDCKNFFNQEGKNLTLNKIMNLFFFFEHLCFEDLVETLQPEYKAKISKDIEEKIIEKLLKNKNPKDKITIKDLGAATRRLISRYLVGQINLSDFKEDRELAFDLSRSEFYEKKVGNVDDIHGYISSKLNEFKLTIGQAYEFYSIIGEDDKNALNINNRNKIIDDNY